MKKYEIPEAEVILFEERIMSEDEDEIYTDISGIEDAGAL